MFDIEVPLVLADKVLEMVSWQQRDQPETLRATRLSQEKINSWFSNEITTFVLTKCQNSPSNKEGVSPAVCRSSKSGFPYRSISSFRERLSIVETLKTRRSS